MISAAAAKALGALFRIPLTNMLGGVGMSYFSCAYSIFMPVYALTVTGLSAAIARVTARCAALGLYRNALRVRRTALVLFSAAGLAGSFIVALFAESFSVWSTGSRDAAPASVMIAPAVFFGCAAAVYRGYYEGLSNMYPTAFSQAAEGIVKVTAGLSLCSYVMHNEERFRELFPYITDTRALAAAAGISGVTLSTAGAAVFLAVMGISDRRGHISTGEKMLSFREISSELIRTALPAGVCAVVTNLTALIDMRTLIGGIEFDAVNCPEGISPAEYSQFMYGSFSGIALTVFNLVPSVTNMLGRGVIPCVTEAWAGSRKDLLRSRTMQALFTAAVLSVPAAAGMAAAAPELLGTLFPGQSDEAAVCIAPLRYLMPGMVCLCLTYPVSGMLQGVGRPAVPLYITLGGTAVKLIGNLLLIPQAGMNGAAISTSVSYMLMLAVSIVWYLSVTGISLSVKPFISVGYSAALCGGGAYLAADIVMERTGEALPSLAAAAVAGASLYFAALMISGGRMIVSWIKKKPAQRQA